MLEVNKRITKYLLSLRMPHQEAGNSDEDRDRWGKQTVIKGLSGFAYINQKPDQIPNNRS